MQVHAFKKQYDHIRVLYKNELIRLVVQFNKIIINDKYIFRTFTNFQKLLLSCRLQVKLWKPQIQSQKKLLIVNKFCNNNYLFLIIIKMVYGCQVLIFLLQKLIMNTSYNNYYLFLLIIKKCISLNPFCLQIHWCKSLAL